MVLRIDNSTHTTAKVVETSCGYIDSQTIRTLEVRGVLLVRGGKRLTEITLTKIFAQDKQLSHNEVCVGVCFGL